MTNMMKFTIVDVEDLVRENLDLKRKLKLQQEISERWMNQVEGYKHLNAQRDMDDRINNLSKYEIEKMMHATYREDMGK